MKKSVLVLGLSALLASCGQGDYLNLPGTEKLTIPSGSPSFTLPQQKKEFASGPLSQTGTETPAISIETIPLDFLNLCTDKTRNGFSVYVATGSEISCWETQEFEMRDIPYCNSGTAFYGCESGTGTVYKKEKRWSGSILGKKSGNILLEGASYDNPSYIYDLSIDGKILSRPRIGMSAGCGGYQDEMEKDLGSDFSLQANRGFSDECPIRDENNTEKSDSNITVTGSLNGTDLCSATCSTSWRGKSGDAIASTGGISCTGVTFKTENQKIALSQPSSVYLDFEIDSKARTFKLLNGTNIFLFHCEENKGFVLDRILGNPKKSSSPSQ